QSADTHEYRSDYRLLALAGPFAEGMPLRVEGGPVLRALSESTHGGAYLAVAHRGEPLIVMTDLYRGQPSPHALGLGQRLSRHASAFGKLFLALNRLAYRDDELTRFTTATITSRHALDEELVEIRRRGYSVNRGENGPVYSFAAPIRAATGELLGAIGIALAPVLAARKSEAHFIELVLRAAEQLESRLAGA
ncbi:MAG: IclR family transcriptional regulator C-terminal domain-containing protein, partial [Verrucomicrobiota bacterium]